MIPAGSGHAPSANGKWGAYFGGHGNWGTVSHSLVLALNFQGNIRFAGYPATMRWA